MTLTAEQLAQLRGQKVAAPFCLMECRYCGEMYPSSWLTCSGDGDFVTCRCPHCNADADEYVADCGVEGEISTEAWNFQQARIEALLDELERVTAERNALREGEMGDARHSNTRAAADIYFQLVEECEIPPGGSLVEHIDSMRERIAELEARTVTVTCPDFMQPEAAPVHYWDRGEQMAYANGYNKSATDLKCSIFQACSSAGVNVEFE
ncbi:hypothetical protein [Atlantibacter subterraneus]|uniref:hypothetical protein n=1 Tax=Atlantibacter subterraneus TaxID=255519 RepID=UPI0021ADE6E7|nr:hypothetical protein [Atlantibacter subterranea]